jgi:hypothetical protein
MREKLLVFGESGVQGQIVTLETPSFDISFNIL